MKCVAVLGGGPAGAFAAEQLARAGTRVRLFDEKLAWEKPCGGGLTAKAYEQYAFLIDNPVPKRLISEIVMGATGAGHTAVSLDKPLLVYSRLDLNRMLLERAAAAGAELNKARVTGVSREGAGWRLETNRGTVHADFCLVATGARNPLRDFGARLQAEDVMFALGYYVEGRQEHIDIEFLDGLRGYIWVFPRCGHLSVGICGKGEPAALLRRRLESYLAERGMAWHGAKFYRHLLPSLASASWGRNRVAGEGWLAVGDAAGLVDPITGEGLYYAIRSGDLAAQAVVAANGSAAQPAETYTRMLQDDFACELEFGSRLAQRVFLGRFIGGSVPARAVQFARRSSRFACTMRDLMSGGQPYSTLKRRLLTNMTVTFAELVRSLALTERRTPPAHP